LHYHSPYYDRRLLKAGSFVTYGYREKEASFSRLRGLLGDRLSKATQYAKNVAGPSLYNNANQTLNSIATEPGLLTRVYMGDFSPLATKALTTGIRTARDLASVNASRNPGRLSRIADKATEEARMLDDARSLWYSKVISPMPEAFGNISKAIEPFT
jgi:hypothetical protein